MLRKKIEKINKKIIIKILEIFFKKIILKYLKILFIFFVFFVKTYAENADKFEPKSHFWLYFIIVFFLLAITFYFYSKTKYIEKNKKNASYSLILLLSFWSSYFLDIDYKNKQIKNLVSVEKKAEVSTKAKLSITQMRYAKLKEKVRELEGENSKLKLLEEKIKNSREIEKNSILSEKDILKKNKIKSNISQIEKDLLAIDNNINKVNSGDFSDNLAREYTILQKLKNKKRQRELELNNNRRSLDNVVSLKDSFKVEVDDELEDMWLSRQELRNFRKEYAEYKKELTKNNRKIILVSGNSKITKSEKKQDNKTEKKYSLQEKFLRNHYDFLVKKNFKKAYEESSKKIDYTTYKDWYKNVEKIIINKVYLKKNTKNNYFVDLDIIEKNSANNYLVLKEIISEKNKNFKIKTSKTIKITKIENKKIWKKTNKIQKKQEKINIKAITNNELKNILKTKNKKYLILDARENIERKTGYIKGSVFFRFAWLLAWNYKHLDKKKIIIVYTWEKTKSQEVANFLKTKGFDVRYLENWVSSWLKSGWAWEGKKDVFKVYKNPKYKKKFTKKELEEKYKDWIYLVDARKKESFEKSHLKWSFNVPLVYLAKRDWAKATKQIPKDSRIVTICDSNISCFYAQVTWIEMAKVGYDFLWYYSLLEK